uniref:Uncharacterized protein n=1 Tax=Tetranychus urticae TaxID=32264 RepID=T1JWQ8_TETUR
MGSEILRPTEYNKKKSSSLIL